MKRSGSFAKRALGALTRAMSRERSPRGTSSPVAELKVRLRESSAQLHTAQESLASLCQAYFGRPKGRVLAAAGRLARHLRQAGDLVATHSDNVPGRPRAFTMRLDTSKDEAALEGHAGQLEALCKDLRAARDAQEAEEATAEAKHRKTCLLKLSVELQDHVAALDAVLERHRGALGGGDSGTDSAVQAPPSAGPPAWPKAVRPVCKSLTGAALKLVRWVAHHDVTYHGVAAVMSAVATQLGGDSPTAAPAPTPAFVEAMDTLKSLSAACAQARVAAREESNPAAAAAVGEGALRDWLRDTTGRPRHEEMRGAAPKPAGGASSTLGVNQDAYAALLECLGRYMRLPRLERVVGAVGEPWHCSSSTDVHLQVVQGEAVGAARGGGVPVVVKHFKVPRWEAPAGGDPLQHTRRVARRMLREGAFHAEVMRTAGPSASAWLPGGTPPRALPPVPPVLGVVLGSTPGVTDCGGGLQLVTAACNGGDLAAATRHPAWGAVDDARLLRLVARIAHCVAQVHAAGVVHGDVKAANVVLHVEQGEQAPLSVGQLRPLALQELVSRTAQGSIAVQCPTAQGDSGPGADVCAMLTDFGSAAFMQEGATSAAGGSSAPPRVPAWKELLQSTVHSAAAGTLRYMPPEGFDASPPPLSRGTDVWALACVALDVLQGAPPYSAVGDEDVWRLASQHAARDGGTPPSPLAPQWVKGGAACIDALQRDMGEPFMRVLRGCLERDASQRASAATLRDAAIEAAAAAAARGSRSRVMGAVSPRDASSRPAPPGSGGGGKGPALQCPPPTPPPQPVAAAPPADSPCDAACDPGDMHSLTCGDGSQVQWACTVGACPVHGHGAHAALQRNGAPPAGSRRVGRRVECLVEECFPGVVHGDTTASAAAAVFWLRAVQCTVVGPTVCLGEGGAGTVRAAGAVCAGVIALLRPSTNAGDHAAPNTLPLRSIATPAMGRLQTHLHAALQGGCPVDAIVEVLRRLPGGGVSTVHPGKPAPPMVRTRSRSAVRMARMSSSSSMVQVNGKSCGSAARGGGRGSEGGESAGHCAPPPAVQQAWPVLVAPLTAVWMAAAGSGDVHFPDNAASRACMQWAKSVPMSLFKVANMLRVTVQVLSKCEPMHPDAAAVCPAWLNATTLTDWWLKAQQVWSAS